MVNLSARAPASRASTSEIWRWLDQVMDPEIPVLSVVDLGIVREVAWRGAAGDAELLVAITPTYSGCPASEVIAADIGAMLTAHGIAAVRLETRLSPPWTTDWMSEKGRAQLKAYGIAPPAAETGVTTRCFACARAAGPVPCPHCGSSDTQAISRFGSTPCKAHYLCHACLEPFDYFKPH